MGEITTKVRTPQRLRFAYSEDGAVEYQLRLVKEPEPGIAKPEALEPDSDELEMYGQVTLKASEPEPVWGDTPVASRYTLYDPDTGDVLYTKETSEPATAVQVPAQPESQPYIPRPYVISPEDGDSRPDGHVTLHATGFRVAHDSDTHVESQWQLFDAGADPEEDDPVLDVTSEEALESFDVPEGEHIGDVQARVRQRGEEYGWSDWSPLSGAFTIVEPEPETPTAEGPSDESWSAYPTLRASEHASNVDETAIASRYRLYDADTGDLLYDSGEIEYTTEHAVPHSELPTDYKG